MKEKKCPIMIKAGYKSKTCLCEIPEEFRELIPDCAAGGECQIAKLMPELAVAANRCSIDGRQLSEKKIRQLKTDFQKKLSSLLPFFLTA